MSGNRQERAFLQQQKSQLEKQKEESAAASPVKSYFDPSTFFSSSVVFKNIGSSVDIDPNANSSWVIHSGNEPAKPKIKRDVVSWDDVKGCDEAKQQLREFIELPQKNPELYKFYNKKVPKGVLLWGAAGCGKTMLVKAAAFSLAETHNKDYDSSGFIYAKASDLNSMWVGECEKNISKLFERARNHHQKHGYPAIIFLDEADSLLAARSDSKPDWHASRVNTFLAEMDGMEQLGAVVILATNRPSVLDSAVIRDGRIDHKIHIPRPSKEAVEAILMATLGKIPLSEGIELAEMVSIAAKEIFCPSKIFYEIETVEKKKYMYFYDLINGAMMTNIAEKATSIAMRKDLEAGTMTGVQPCDIKAAIESIFESNKGLNHKDDIAIFTEGDEVVSVSKYKPEEEYREALCS